MIARTLRNIATALMLAVITAPALGATQQARTVEQHEIALEQGGGWVAKATCVGCLVGAGITLYSGAAVWIAIVASTPASTLGVVTACFAACSAAYGPT